MLTQIDVNSENAFTVPIRGATPKDSLLVRKITGLNPADIGLFIGDYSRDGGSYQGRRVGNRNVVITMDLNPNPALGETTDGLRALLHKAFLDPLVDADYFQLNFHDDSGSVKYLYGYTEKFEYELFDVDTSLQISVICPDPYLRDVNLTQLDNIDLGWTTVPFNYTGTAETGFEVTIKVTAATPTLTLDNNGKKMVINRSFSLGDIIYINTTRGSRAMTILHSAGTPQPLIASLTPDSPWLTLHSQANTLRLYGATTADAPAVVQQLKFRQAYWGL